MKKIYPAIKIPDTLIDVACDYEQGEDVDLDAKANESYHAIKSLIADQVREARIDELGKLMPPVADMIPEWKWPCYVCGFDRELLRKHIEDRIAALKGDK